MVDDLSQQLSNQHKRVVPKTELDLQLMFTEPVYGKNEIAPALRSLLNKYYADTNKKGEPIITSKSLWDLLGYFTRDMRLGNLSFMEIKYCQYFLDLAGDFLQAELVQPFTICLSRVATVLELSQSRNGFLRRRINTFTQEGINQNIEPPKKSLFGETKQIN